MLDDESFQRSLDDVAKEPVPYFRQLCESTYSSSRPSSAQTSDSYRSEPQSDFDHDDDDVEFGAELDFGRQVVCGLQLIRESSNPARKKTLEVFFILF